MDDQIKGLAAIYNPRQAVLDALANGEPRHATDIANATSLERDLVVRIVDPLIAEGHVEEVHYGYTSDAFFVLAGRGS